MEYGNAGDVEMGLSVSGGDVTHDEMAKNATWLDIASALGIAQQTEKLGWRQFPKVTNPSLIR